MKYDEYVKSNQTPKDLCAEIDNLKKTIKQLRKEKKILSQMRVEIEKRCNELKCCENCKLHKHECLSNGESCKNWEFIKG